jgi:hypothetical protein
MTRQFLKGSLWALLCIGAIIGWLWWISPSDATSVIPGPPSYVIQQFNYTHITADTTTTIKSGSGVLHTICINNPTATAVLTAYDNTAASGTEIAIITESSTTQSCFTYDVAFTTGLTILTATATSDITISWY